MILSWWCHNGDKFAQCCHWDSAMSQYQNWDGARLGPDIHKRFISKQTMSNSDSWENCIDLTMSVCPVVNEVFFVTPLCAGVASLILTGFASYLSFDSFFSFWFFLSSKSFVGEGVSVASVKCAVILFAVSLKHLDAISLFNLIRIFFQFIGILRVLSTFCRLFLQWCYQAFKIYLHQLFWNMFKFNIIHIANIHCVYFFPSLCLHFSGSSDFLFIPNTLHRVPLTLLVEMSLLS